MLSFLVSIHFGVLKVRSGPFAQSQFQGDIGNITGIGSDMFKILLVGAGGLGCELLKNMALSGFKHIYLIDLDSIDVSNLNRQFLFRSGDEGKWKAEVAAARVREVVPDCNITPFVRKIQSFEREWYKQFRVVIAGLDNQPARSWLNETLCDLVEYDEDGKVDPETIIPLIDGGTEGFMGQSRIFFPHRTSCFNCQAGSDAGGPDLHMCTVAVTPRVPEHCALYAHLFLWDRLYEFRSAIDYKMLSDDEIQQGQRVQDDQKIKLDKDDGHHMTWLYNRGQEWADKHNIKGLTYALTQQVIKNIIPAVAATNATVAAACVNECFKYISYCAPNVDNYLSYNGKSLDGVYARTFRYFRKCEEDRDYNNVEFCDHCDDPIVINAPKDITWADLKSRLSEGNFIDPKSPQLDRQGISRQFTDISDVNYHGRLVNTSGTVAASLSSGESMGLFTLTDGFKGKFKVFVRLV